MFCQEINKVNAEISKERNINVLEVEKIIKSYHKGIASKIAIDEPCIIRLPHLGTLVPNKIYMKDVKLNEDEANNA